MSQKRDKCGHTLWACGIDAHRASVANCVGQDLVWCQVDVFCATLIVVMWPAFVWVRYIGLCVPSNKILKAPL